MPIDLAVSLGHNASCVAISSVTGHILVGYEEERLTGIKSDSSYPILSIEKCLKVLNRPHIRNVYISHWFAQGQLKKCKYYDKGHMQSLGADKIVSVSKDFTHHDAHNYSAIAFAQSSPGFEDGYYSLVIDGFGTQGECVSIYQCTSANAKFAKTRLLHRAFGYNKSLGILYQYATAFLGMKMQQDEYKLLGYEAHSDMLDNDDFPKINECAKKMAKRYFEGIMDPMAIDKDQDPIVNINALKETKDSIFKELWALIEEFGIDDRTVLESRVIISMLVQRVVEMVVLQLVGKFGMEKIICSGGVFMNVKLNLKLAEQVDQICVMPLAGDQGAALGLYHYHCKNLQWPNHLYWGVREWEGFEKLYDEDGISVFSNKGDFVDEVIAELDRNGYVNVIINDMEYGPRALCNTTTLAHPDRQMTEEINELNDRVTVMPMAPVMTAEMAYELLDPIYTKYHKSLDYMIAACYLKPGVDSMDGAAHLYKKGWHGGPYKTCRPQILGPEHPIFEVLEAMKHPLINTSFNYHGVPIVYGVNDIINSHRKQNENGLIRTFVLSEEIE